MIENFLFLTDNQHIGLVHGNEFYPVAYLDSNKQVVFTDSHFTPSEYDATFMVHPTVNANNPLLAHASSHLGKHLVSFLFYGGILSGFSVYHYNSFGVPTFTVKYNVLHKEPGTSQKYNDHRTEFGANDLHPDQELMILKILNQLARLR